MGGLNDKKQRILKEAAEILSVLATRFDGAGKESVKAAITTGFLEGLQHLQELDPVLWQPLLGSSAKAHCTAMNNVYGIDA